MQLGEAIGHIPMGSPVEAVPPKLVSRVIQVGQAIQKRFRRHGLMKRSIENGDVLRVGQQGAAGIVSLEVVRDVKRRQVHRRLNQFQHCVVDQHGLLEVFAPVHDAVAHALDLR